MFVYNREKFLITCIGITLIIQDGSGTTALRKGISFIYASSAATYGDGAFGFSDDIGIKGLIPLNAYGYSKQMFDLWAEKQTDKPKQHVGMKFLTYTDLMSILRETWQV
jgi:ADP-glyceromanno-heptose 6-epimerase precursor (EC 5.1.3.20)